MKTKNSYPLTWPATWKRTSFRRVSNFGARSVERAVYEILHQLKLLGVGDWEVVVSTNLPLRKDGLPYSNLRQPLDPGVAVFFKINKRDCVLACDKWDKAEDNLWAVAKDIEAQRGRIRWGVGSVDQAFAGYTALPEPAREKPWWEILGVSEHATTEQVSAAFKSLAKQHHPDLAHGDNAAMVRVNRAYQAAQADLSELHSSP